MCPRCACLGGAGRCIGRLILERKGGEGRREGGNDKAEGESRMQENK